MKPGRQQFLDSRKAITLMGMSGAGKTHTARMLAKNGWAHYSCDYVIGSGHLDLNVTRDNLSALSAYIGKVGNPAKGGLALAEFRRRQKIYIDAECAAIRAAGAAIAKAPGDFVHDSTGSLCEIEDQSLIAGLAEKTLFVYIRVGKDEEKDILKRAETHPKPLYFPPAFFHEWLGDYMKKEKCAAPEDINPDAFAGWVFPKLFASRVPKYERLAEMYGVTVEGKDIGRLTSADEFVDLVAEALDV